MINSNAEEAKHQHELRDQQKHHEAAEKAKQAEMIAEEKKDGLFDNGNGTNVGAQPEKWRVMWKSIAHVCAVCAGCLASTSAAAPAVPRPARHRGSARA